MSLRLAPDRVSYPLAPRSVRHRFWLPWAGLAALVVSLTAYWLSVWSQPRYFSMIDTRVYLAGARTLLHGGGLYAMRATGAHLQFTYPPAAAVLFSWMPVVGLWWTKVVSAALSQCAFIGCVWLMVCWLQVPRRACWGITGLAAAGLLWLEPVQATLHFGQVNLLVMLLILADLTRRPRWIPPGVLIGAAAGLKLVPAIFIAYLLLAGRGRAACAAVGVFAGSIALGFAVTPVQSASYWSRFAFDTGRVGSVAHVSNQSLYGLIARLSGGPAAANGTWLAVAVIVGAAGLCTAAVLHRAGQVVTGALACACTGLLISPVSWNHHWVWAAPVAVALGHCVWRTRSLWAALALCGCCRSLPAESSGDVPRSFGREYRWHGWQLVAGNAYILAGLGALTAFAVLARHEWRRTGNSPRSMRTTAPGTQIRRNIHCDRLEPFPMISSDG